MESFLHHPAPVAPGSRTIRFEGATHGSAISFFLVDYDPGKGPPLHAHPYSETWTVRRGEAEFTVGANKVRARKGDVVVGPPGVPHKFVNVGKGRLEAMCIHASDRIIQTNLDEG
ncbi:cupin domain-containing protein [Mesorhizobium sp. NBSH29]|uniref:cupin domain-containing protein n=1 Tax=Mesorhizobium sp. NBSH29 TaxID=2654249 RepID=UPI0018966BCF|nr:cupin domain-containing protein [Mesorhizobium sp. NBSH29]QPC85780.1 cupin domain-containing protein [Mesorhizobium sp. NBSH29]